VQFEGILEGNGLSIRNLSITAKTIDNVGNENEFASLETISSSRAIGMFAAMSNGASIKNLDIYVSQVVANADIVGAITGILDESYIYNVNLMPDTSVSVTNHVLGRYIAGGAVGLVIGNAEKYKVSNVSSSISVAATDYTLPAANPSGEVNTIQNAEAIYAGFRFGNSSVYRKDITIEELKDTNYSYQGLSIAAGIVGVTSTKVSNNSSLTQSIEVGFSTTFKIKGLWK